MHSRVVGTSTSPQPLMKTLAANAVMSHTTPPPKPMKRLSRPRCASRAAERIFSMDNHDLNFSPLGRMTLFSGRDVNSLALLTSKTHSTRCP